MLHVEKSHSAVVVSGLVSDLLVTAFPSSPLTRSAVASRGGFYESVTSHNSPQLQTQEDGTHIPVSSESSRSSLPSSCHERRGWSPLISGDRAEHPASSAQEEAAVVGGLTLEKSVCGLAFPRILGATTRRQSFLIVCDTVNCWLY